MTPHEPSHGHGPVVTRWESPSQATWTDLRSEKVQSWHHDRLAVVYVRQSTPQQVLEHQESTRLQYGLTARAQALGWAPGRVLVIDDDQGKSGASAVDRAGFQRLVSEVSLNHVGLILGVEMSRLARSNADWHRLLELCALFGTLLADTDGLYDPAQYNDRLLLGLKGTMSEAELHLLKQRMHQGKRNKARRGELAIPLPIGYVRRPSGEVTFDPDEQVQHVLRLVFRKFGDLGTLNALLRYLVAHEIRLGFRVREGPAKGELEWRRPNRVTLQTLLKHPIYAGVYAYGRRQVDPRRQVPGQPRSGRLTRDPTTWVAFLRDRLPAYISWEQHEWNLARLRANQARADTLGVARQGTALLVGLVVCAVCGHRMTVRYSGRGAHHLYVCTRQLTDYGGPACQQFAAACLETFVSQQVVAALAPAALELSLATLEVLQRERDELGRLWQQRRERAAYEADRAGRQFHLVDPENRLVARQLEREWEAKLAAQQHLEEEHDRVGRSQPRTPSAAECEAVRRLAADLPALWDAPTTTVAERKELLRQVVEQVLVGVEGASERLRVTVTWVGGWQTSATVIRPVARLTQLSYYAHLCQRLRGLAAEGLSAAAIAARLNEEGVRPPKRREQFGEQGVRDLLQRLGGGPRHALPASPPPDQRPPRAPRGEALGVLGPHEWWLSDLARAVDMPHVTLFTWIRRGWVQARRQDLPPPTQRRWILWADEAELGRLRARHQRPAGEDARRRWASETVTPTGPTPPTTASHEALQ